MPKDDTVQKNTGQKKQACKNCEGKGRLKKGEKVFRCQRCGGTGFRR
jgi:DnaJ-class molecular chaperone